MAQPFSAEDEEQRRQLNAGLRRQDLPIVRHVEVVQTLQQRSF
jgi:hypothetical protein